jgi:hypothetical protein
MMRTQSLSESGNVRTAEKTSCKKPGSALTDDNQFVSAEGDGRLNIFLKTCRNHYRIFVSCEKSLIDE